MNNPYAVGSKIYLRAPTLEDAEGAWHGWFSDPEITKYLIDRYLPNSKEAQLEYFQSLSDSKDRVVFSVCTVADDKHIGVCGLSSVNWFHKYADYTYVIGETQPDNACIVIEVVKLLLEVAFNRLNLDNVKSVHVGCNPVTPVIDKLFGFKVIGSLKEIVTCQGQSEDLVISQLSKQSWIARNQESN